MTPVTRVALLLGLMAAFAPACGDGGGDAPDAGQPDAARPSCDPEQGCNPGFVKPTEPTHAWVQPADADAWQDVGLADWSCLGQPSPDVVPTVDITLSGTASDFQTGNGVPGATIRVFHGIDVATVVGTVTAESAEGTAGNYAGLLLPAPTDGTTRWGFEVTSPTTLDTLLLNQYFAPDQAAQSRTIASVSDALVAIISTALGILRDPARGVLAGAMRDCQGREVSNAIATVSTTSGTATHLAGAQTYYFRASTPNLPERHEYRTATNSDGLFTVLQLEPAAEAYLQVWGYPTAEAATAGGDLTLLAELRAPVIADTVITASIEPLRAH